MGDFVQHLCILLTARTEQKKPIVSHLDYICVYLPKLIMHFIRHHTFRVADRSSHLCLSCAPPRISHLITIYVYILNQPNQGITIKRETYTFKNIYMRSPHTRSFVYKKHVCLGQVVVCKFGQMGRIYVFDWKRLCELLFYLQHRCIFPVLNPQKKKIHR